MLWPGLYNVARRGGVSFLGRHLPFFADFSHQASCVSVRTRGSKENYHPYNGSCCFGHSLPPTKLERVNAVARPTLFKSKDAFYNTRLNPPSSFARAGRAHSAERPPTKRVSLKSDVAEPSRQSPR
jgi:hypothetical protein